MITAKTNDGFTVQLDDDTLNDAELLEAMTTMDKDISSLFFLRDRVLPPEDKKRLYDHLRNEKGVVPADALGTALGELLNSFAAGKNSASSPT